MSNIERALKDTHCWVTDECGNNAVEAIQSLITAEVESVLDRLDKSMPTAEQLTTKYGYHMPEKQYGYKLALHDIREVISAMSNQASEDEVAFIVNEYRDINRNEFTQVTANCKCGRGGWVRLDKHPDVQSLIRTEKLKLLAHSINQTEAGAMIGYRDTTFCASEVTEHTCGREFTEQDAIDAEKWWGSKDYPVAYGKFCKEADNTQPDHIVDVHEMVVDNTQELYEIEQVIRSVLTPNSYIVPQEGIELTKAILDWNNKQVEAVLDRLKLPLKGYKTHRIGSHSDDWGGESDRPCFCDLEATIKAERAKLKESSDESNI